MLAVSGKMISMNRFWSKVNKTGGCWLWTACIRPDGYGAFSLNAKARLAHRLAYIELVGPIPEGKTLDHLCRVRNCVNPDHLEPVSIAENVQRGINYWRNRTHCSAGHEYTPENTMEGKNGAGLPCRVCRKCHNENGKLWVKKNLASRAAYMRKRRALLRMAS